MRNRIVILSDPACRENVASVATYRRALDLWRIPYRVVAVDGLQPEDLARAAVAVAEDVRRLSAREMSALGQFVREGGHLILGGLVGMEAAGALPEPLAILTGVTHLQSRETWPTCRVPLIAEEVDWLAPWEAGIVLFFHNPAYASAARGRDFEMKLASGARVVARSYLADGLDADAQTWGNYRDDEAPSLVENRPFAGGGRVIYAPLPFGLVDEARCMVSTHGIVRADMPQENHATLLLIKTALCALAQAGGGIVPSVALWPRAARAVFSLSGDVHEYPDLLAGNLRCEFSYIPKMQELMARKGLAHKFTYYLAGRVAEHHPAVVREIADEDVLGHTYADLSYYVENAPYEVQVKDMAAALAAIQRVLPLCRSFRLGWRNHGVTGNQDSRRAIEDFGFLYASDYQCSADVEWNWKLYPRRMIVHVNYPMRTRKPDGGRYNFWELPYCQSDIDLMQRAERKYDPDERTWFHGPGEARRVWGIYVERAVREEALVVTLWHPWASLRKPEEQAEIEATIDHMRQKDGVAFLTNSEVALWWDARASVRARFTETNEGWEAWLENPANRDLNELTIVLKGGGGRVGSALCEGEEMPVQERDGDAMLWVDLPARGERVIRFALRKKEPR